MPLLARLGTRASRLLHDVIYSFPSSVNTSSPSEPQTLNKGLVDLITEPGEPRALAGGVGPLSFAGSGYGVVLVLMAILLNRIHHIVRRPRVPPPPLPHPVPASLYGRLKVKLSELLISPDMPRYLRIPGLIALARAWMLFSILTLQVADLWPVNHPWLAERSYGRTISRVGNWAGGMEMETACWQVFLSVCVSLISSSLANGLDRTRRRDPGAGFNLFGYSFLLHLYSSPLTHDRPPAAANHGRPDINALLQLWLSLTELTWLQAVELSIVLRRNQLFPSAVCGMLGLSHFVYAIWTSPLKFPSFTFLTHLLALFLLIVITISLLLKGVTHIFTLGYLPSPVFVNLLPHEGAIPSIEDDFGVALLKLGTACIEATQFSGLRNELVAIEKTQTPWLELTQTGSEILRPNRYIQGSGGFSSEITDIKVSRLEDPHTQRTYWTEWNKFWRACGNSLGMFAWALLMATPVGRKTADLSQDAWRARWWYGPRQWRFWRRQAWREPPITRAGRMARRLEHQAQLRQAARQLQAGQLDATSTAIAMTPSGLRRRIERVQSQSPVPGPSTLAIDSTPYADFLRGDIMSDDEDAENDWQDEAETMSHVSAAEAEDDGLEFDIDVEVEEQGPGLYLDLVNDDSDAENDLQPVLLAHMTSSSASPLTRRRYAALLTSSAPSPSRTPSGGQALAELTLERRLAAQHHQRDDWDDERRTSCVVCTVEPRDTILWPCRCLALCNDCRESLAARLSAADHMCPCCRRNLLSV